jgi:hypothetical protein
MTLWMGCFLFSYQGKKGKKNLCNLCKTVAQ